MSERDDTIPGAMSDIGPFTERTGSVEPTAGSPEPPPDVVEETVDGLPVLAEARPVERAAPASLPAVQAAAAMATGFVAGAATIALVKRASGRKLARAGRTVPRRAADMLPIVGSRTFLVDIHLIGRPEE